MMTNPTAELKKVLEDFYQTKDISKMKALVEAGADVNTLHKERNVLICAIMENNHDAVRYFLDKGADVTIEPRQIWKDALQGYRNISDETILLLIERGLNVNEKLYLSSRPCRSSSVLTVANSNAASLPVIKAIVDRGVKVTGHELVHAINYGRKKDILLFLVDKIDDINDGKDDTPLTALSRQITDIDVLKAMIRKGANVNKIDKYGSSPLLYIADKARIFHMFIEKRKRQREEHMRRQYYDEDEIDKKDEKQLNNLKEIAKILIENGADKTMKDVKGFTALDYAPFLLQPNL